MLPRAWTELTNRVAFDCWNDYRNWPGNRSATLTQPDAVKTNGDETMLQIMRAASVIHSQGYCMKRRPARLTANRNIKNLMHHAVNVVMNRSENQQAPFSSQNTSLLDKKAAGWTLSPLLAINKEGGKNVLSDLLQVFWLGYNRLSSQVSRVLGESRQRQMTFSSPLFAALWWWVITPKLLYSVKRSHLRGF